MGLDEFQIQFDNPLKIYHEGQTVSGQIILVLDSPERIRGIIINVKGEANTFWKAFLNKQQLRYTGYEEIFFLTSYIAGANTGQKIELFPGKYVYPFQFSLPQNVSSSFESDLGNIRYKIEASLDQEIKQNKRYQKLVQTTKNTFAVMSNYDLNNDPRALESVMVEKTKSIGCFCPSQPITVNFSIPVRGYVPGQLITIKVNIENESEFPVYEVKIQLEKKVTFRVKKPSCEIKTTSTILATVRNYIIEREDIVSYEQLLQIPSIVSTNLKNCSIINVKYILLLEAYVDRWYCPILKSSIPVLMGTIPLSKYQSSMTSPMISVPMSPLSTSSTSPPSVNVSPPDYSSAVISSTEDLCFNSPPPSYEEINV